MTSELTALGYAFLLQAVQFALMAVPLNLQMGPRATAGPRDQMAEPQGVPGRLYRAFNNHFEALILFTIAVVLVTLGDQSSPVTRSCAWTYLVARILYVPAYASGILYLRSAIWAVGFFATLVMVLAALIP